MTGEARLSELYDQDFLLWTEEQAALLRRAKDANLPLDWENLAEEIDSLGKSQRAALRSQLRRILRHLFKLEASLAREPRPGWEGSTREARVDIEDILEDSPSLRRETSTLIAKQLPIAAKLAAADLARDGEPADPVWSRWARGVLGPAGAGRLAARSCGVRAASPHLRSLPVAACRREMQA